MLNIIASSDSGLEPDCLSRTIAKMWIQMGFEIYKQKTMQVVSVQ